MKVEILHRRVYLIGGNGKTLTMSEQYATNWNAKRAAKRMFPTMTPEVIKDDSNGTTGN